jgi:Ca2+-binding RTX toxin-like protein
MPRGKYEKVWNIHGGYLEGTRQLRPNNTTDFDDTLEGNNGNDTLVGLGGADSLMGGKGNDLLAGGGDNGDVLNGGDGVDTASYALGRTNEGIVFSNAPVEVDLAGGWARIGTPPKAGDRDVRAINSLISIENVIGGVGDDTLRGDKGGNVLEGFDGNDSLEGREGDDTLIGGKGADTLDGGAGTDLAHYGMETVRIEVDLEKGEAVVWRTPATGEVDSLFDIENVLAGTGNDELRGTRGDNLLDGSGGNDFIDGREGDDTLFGRSGADTLVGGDGKDLIIGNDGIDLLTGGDGQDTFKFVFVSDSPFKAEDTITDFVNDLIDLGTLLKHSGIASGDVEYIGAKAFAADGKFEIRFDAPAGRLEFDVNNNGVYDKGDFGILMALPLFLSDKSFLLEWPRDLVELDPTGGDTLVADAGDDTWIGYCPVGGDTLDGGAGEDTMLGGHDAPDGGITGEDTASGGDTTDSIAGATEPLSAGTSEWLLG